MPRALRNRSPCNYPSLSDYTWTRCMVIAMNGTLSFPLLFCCFYATWGNPGIAEAAYSDILLLYRFLWSRDGGTIDPQAVMTLQIVIFAKLFCGLQILGVSEILKIKDLFSFRFITFIMQCKSLSLRSKGKIHQTALLSHASICYITSFIFTTGSG